MAGEGICDCLLKIIEYPPAQFHGMHYGRKVVVQQNKCRRFARNIRTSPSHGDSNIRSFQGWRIVYPVTRHGDDLVGCLERPYEPQLLLGDNARKDLLAAHLHEPCIGISMKLIVESRAFGKAMFQTIKYRPTPSDD